MKLFSRRNAMALLGCTVAGAAMIATSVSATTDPDTKAPPKVGEQAMNFKLVDTEGKEHSLQFYLDRGDTVVLEWFNPDCPIVKKHHQHNKTMAETYDMFKDRKVTWLAINSGAKGNQGTGVERNKKAIEDYGIKYPVLLDETGEVGKMYGAKTTPHMFIITPNKSAASEASDTKATGTLAYIGAIDNDRSASKVGDINYVKNALLSIERGETIEVTSTKSYGCGVKY
ncbi:MAG: redoxin domain-containing protein [Phycisphaeraceae bacterium]|nr:redoxin domain-containing protein [Phycisphaerales bacterium]MCB9861136.1 redoxin domain-containing protein [Phycisphaeraceae bacterium]